VRPLAREDALFVELGDRAAAWLRECNHARKNLRRRPWGPVRRAERRSYADSVRGVAHRLEEMHAYDRAHGVFVTLSQREAVRMLREYAALLDQQEAS
jgi:hypothetical protein